MITIGLLHIRRDPNLVSRAYLYSALAHAEGHRLFYFTSRDVDFEKRTINARFYNSGSWVERETPFPDVVMNVTGPVTARQREIYERLEQIVPFTSHHLGNKTVVYRKLIAGKAFLPYVIPYRLVRDVDEVLDYINRHERIVLKPNGDSHGNRVYYVEKMQDGYRIIIRDRVHNISVHEVKAKLVNMLSGQHLVAQKYINSRRKSGAAYDFRLHVQKNGSGTWQVTAVLPRIASDERIITNLSQGSYLCLFERFLESEFPEQHREMKLQIQAFALLLARHLDEIYDCDFDELGIDVGVDEAGKIWIYEINWRPGHVFIEVKAARAAIQYATYLARKKKEGDNEETKPERINQDAGN